MATRLTMAQVAAECGVSVMTVSNAYNRPDQLSAALRARILDTAARLGYPGPNAAGRALRRGRSDVLGVLLTADLAYAFTDPGSIEFLHGVTVAAAEHRCGLQLIPAVGPAAARMVRNAAVDGLIVYSAPDGDAAVRAALERRLPVVVLGGPSLPGVDLVRIDNEGAARQAARHLVDLGHRRIAVIAWRLRLDDRAGPIPAARVAQAEYEVFRLRLAGYLDALPAGVEVTLWEQPGHSVEEGRAAARALLDVPADRRPTGILASTDVLALGVLAEARDLGLDVPGDVSVIGFDDIADAARAVPPLTTVHQSLYDQGHLCATRLVTGARPTTTTAPTSLVIRSSTGPVPTTPGG